jgi:FKBP-type peptidyl-prolyl cis-trans isomerase FklB
MTIRYSMGMASAAAVLIFAVGACEKNEAGETAAAKPAESAPAQAGAAAEGAGKVVTTASGLKYEVIQEGTGKQPTLNDSVTVNYRGTLTNGKEFDSSYSRGKPATFPVSGVIKGWTEALQLMKEGAKYKLTIPPDLAYGSRGAGGVIGPNETLIFEVELIKVN